MATSDATTRIDVGPIHRAEIRELEQRFGVVAWFGFHTRRWWALVGDRLVEAATPAGLADAVMAVRGAATPPARPWRKSPTRPGLHQRPRRQGRSLRRSGGTRPKP